jgi:hypothetical protein
MKLKKKLFFVLKNRRIFKIIVKTKIETNNGQGLKETK